MDQNPLLISASFQPPRPGQPAGLGRLIGASAPLAAAELAASVDVPVVILAEDPRSADQIEAGAATKIPIKLVWNDDKKTFNSHLKLVGLPDGANGSERGRDTKDVTAELELNPSTATELRDLRVEAILDYHRQPLIVQSEPFTIPIIHNADGHKD